MFTNGLGAAGVGMHPAEFTRALAGHRKSVAKRAKRGEDTPHPDQLGYAMILEARRGETYGGTVPSATVARRRARNKAARKARRIGRTR